MAVKELTLEGYGMIHISGIGIKDREFETVNPNGESVVREVIGERAKTVYKTKEGTIVPGTQLCKKILIEDEEIIAPKFTPTKEVDNENIEEVSDNSMIYRALERKFYNVTTENGVLKNMILEQNVNLKFPISMGSGWKLWNGILTNWQGKMLMVCCRGDLVKELEKYADETVEFEIDLIPQQKNMKKLVKAMIM